MNRRKGAAKKYVGEIAGTAHVATTKRKINKICGFNAASIRRDPALKIFHVYRVYVAESCLRRHSAKSLIRKVRR